MEYKNDNKKMYNMFVKNLDGKTLTLLFPSPIAYANSIKDRLFELTGIPTQHQSLVTGCGHLNDEKSVIWCSPEGGNTFPSMRLLVRQNKTNNLDACWDVSWRRLIEKRLEEWKAEEEWRKLEKVTEEFLKKHMKDKCKKGVKYAKRKISEEAPPPHPHLPIPKMPRG